MNDLAIIPAHHLPMVSQSLGYILDISPDTPPREHDIAEAVRKLPAAKRVCQPATTVAIASWVRRFSILPRAPSTPEGVNAAITAICAACGQLPAFVWCDATFAEGARTWKWWPSPAEVFALLEPHARAAMRLRDGLRRIAAMTPALVLVAPERTPSAREHVARIVGEFVAEQEAKAADHERASKLAVKPAYLTDRHLVDVWSKLADEGMPGAADRLAALHRKISGEA